MQQEDPTDTATADITLPETTRVCTCNGCKRRFKQWLRRELRDARKRAGLPQQAKNNQDFEIYDLDSVETRGE